jgi:hypothetical protein
MNAAARWIAQEEPGSKRLHRSSRLSPLRDISSEIQRASTPHPRTLQQQPESTANPLVRETAATGGNEASESRLKRIWSLLSQEEEEEEDERGSDIWAETTDPLMARTRPGIGEAASIEAEDMLRAQLENHLTLPYPGMHRQPPPSPPRRRLSFWRIVFALLVIVAVVALGIDGILLSFAFHHSSQPSTQASAGPPTLTLSTDVLNAGGMFALHLTHFPSGTHVALTHDIQETLTTTAGVSELLVDASGQASASVVVTSSWTPGTHLIVAEDVTTRDTATAILQISGNGPSRPPHLLLDAASLSLGTGAQGASTIQPLVLHNAGSGSITWSVSSNQPWLLVAPRQGTFGTGQVIEVAAQRNNLAPGNYNGTITLSSNVDEPEQVAITMKVTSLPPDAGSMISLSPSLLSFTATDGESTPQSQIITLSNPAQQKLNWSLAAGQTISTIESATSTQPTPAISNPWLSASPSSGSLGSGQSVQVVVTVRSEALLPGSYISTLTFQGPSVYDTPQLADVALTIQPHCGLITSTGSLSFTAVTGQSMPSPHVLSLNATSSCAGETLPWQVHYAASWLTVSPSSGQVKGTNSSFTSVGVNTAGLKPGKYTTLLTFQTASDTQTVLVELLLQPPPAPSVPILGALPLSLNFSAIQGESNPAGQVVTITNNGGSQLNWHTSINSLGAGWLGVSASSGTVGRGLTGQFTVNVVTQGLTPGTYASQITLLGTDSKGSEASGSPQTITVDLIVQPPCTLAQPSSSSLLFTGIAGGSDPVAQTVTVTASGSCVWPLTWNAAPSSSASWLTLSPASGTLSSLSQQANIGVNVDTDGLSPGSYSVTVKIMAADSNSLPLNNTPQSFTVTLTILQPCTLQSLPSSLTFNVSQDQITTPSQTLNLSETGSCNGGVSWTANGDSNSSSWLNLSANSGTDNGSGSSFSVTIIPGTLAPGSYTGQVTVSASNNGVVLKGSPQTVTVNLTVSGYTLSGSALACGGPSPDCSTSQGLGAATVTLVDSSNNTVATVTTDSSGNFVLNNIPLGSYTLSVTGTLNGATYSGSQSITVSGAQSNLTVNAFSD